MVPKLKKKTFVVVQHSIQRCWNIRPTTTSTETNLVCSTPTTSSLVRMFRFFKIRGTGDFLATPFVASVLTAPAPNSRPYLDQEGDLTQLEECFERRWRNVLAAAQDQQISTLLLGAWGCGAFGGDPQMASRTAHGALCRFRTCIRQNRFCHPWKRQAKQT